MPEIPLLNGSKNRVSLNAISMVRWSFFTPDYAARTCNIPLSTLQSALRELSSVKNSSNFTMASTT